MTARTWGPGRRAALAAATLAVLATSACESDRRAIGRDDLPAVPARPDIEIIVDDEGFSRSVLDVGTDTLVRFVVTEGEHRLRSDTGIDTGVIRPGESTDVVFDEPGVHRVSAGGDGSELVVTAADEVRATDPALSR